MTPPSSILTFVEILQIILHRNKCKKRVGCIWCFSMLLALLFFTRMKWMTIIIILDDHLCEKMQQILGYFNFSN